MPSQELSLSRLSILEFDFKNWGTLLAQVQKLVNAEVVGFCTLGTTIKVAGSKEEFYRIDVESVAQFAIVLEQLGAIRFIVISSQGASEKSAAYYLKCKGEMERRSTEVFSKNCVFVRPGLLLGDRQENRPAEKIFAHISNALPFLFSGPLKKFKPIHVGQVAKAMLILSKPSTSASRIQHFENIELHAL